MPAPDAIAYVRAALPPAPARVLEIGAGDGALAQVLRGAGYDVTAIDPVGEGDVLPVPLLELAPSEPFDAAVAMTSLHHVEPLEASLCHLAERLLRPGARLVVDEYDVAALDERAARWWLDKVGKQDEDPAHFVAHMRDHIASVPRLREALAVHFDVSEPVPGAYLYRHKLGLEHRAEEERLIAAGEIPATGSRFIAIRR
ncbi:class I SAM-dependent methyltransferase [Solirubrobacter sp. CPCC 204708]|uniref:Class I SAM-dependent methyltransferase n=1 Tax=Solirubrobacter deserti TaxID=2282478 RepID=A0ABT4RFV6_9ACTN|nr:class I SAM-dependent methyltransferase [Solirubrobacter deserti]MBE2318148.1 class I SAM-dependent methyltransferase [Solirubrobacter deserti]MDA0137427.1 class I SAM-dependent methyltransferase [Solirubrobacter deserti]